MGLIKKIADRLTGQTSTPKNLPSGKDVLLRRCYFEVMEQRRVLSADPVVAAVTYLEGDAGQDTTPDHFEVSFEGGSDTTSLSQFSINGDQDGSGGLSDGDMFFDVAAGLPGTGGFHGFQFDATNSQGITAADIQSFEVSADGLQLTVSAENFAAGDVLAFTLDIDEVERFRVDKIASGVEFEGSLFEAVFEDENYTFESQTVAIITTLEDGYVQSQQSGIFFDEYDQLFFTGGELADQSIGLALDNAGGTSDRTAGSIEAYQLVPKPISISGNVSTDSQFDCDGDHSEFGISGVGLTLERLDSVTGQYEVVAATVTDDQGNYEFAAELNLEPGIFRVVETQPEGYLSVGESVGSSGGVAGANVISDIDLSVGGSISTDYDFTEIKPATLSGNVWSDENNNGVLDSGEPGIANVLIKVTRVDSNGAGTGDPFASFGAVFVRTDTFGHYEVDALPPGVYEIQEITEYSGEPDPLAGYLDGKDSVGSVGGASIGVEANDKFSQISLCAESSGAEYNFGELRPAEIGGTVWHDINNDGVIQANEDRLENVVIQLFDKQGNELSEMRTDANGQYQFNNLYPGEYLVREIQPAGFTDGQDPIGQVNGITSGDYLSDDAFCVKLDAGDQGRNYDFGELKAASISGQVHADANGDCTFDVAQGDLPLANVKLVLVDSNGSEVARTVTDANGMYSFDDLAPGKYSVREFTPSGYLNGDAVVGTVNGESVGFSGDGDFLGGIELKSGDQGTHYDFCENIPAELCGTVYFDRNNDGVQNPGEEGIEGTRLVLTDGNGNVVAATFTDASGRYCFSDLVPGIYCVREIQPVGFIDGIDSIGEVQGTPSGVAENDKLADIQLIGGVTGDHYNFGELKPSDISGRVHVDQNGNCVYDASAGEMPLVNVSIELVNSQGMVVAETLTNASGEYHFSGVLPGEYTIREIQPANYDEGGVKPGSGGGIAGDNLISGIVVSADQTLTHYDFCEVESTSPPVIPPGTPPSSPPVAGNPLPPSPGIAGMPGLLGAQDSNPIQFVNESRALFYVQTSATPYTWHLSVINAGVPRGVEDGAASTPRLLQAGYISNRDWTRFDMTEAVWSLSQTTAEGISIVDTEEPLEFGMLKGIPVVGDFNGDGDDEFGVFKDGYWMIDLNGNQRWDSADLMVRLGEVGDRPIVGDWDGDGKDDVGIYGPIWELDREAIAREHGLPNPENQAYTPPKNIPPSYEDANVGSRVMMKSRLGSQRADVVDHVFGMGDGEEVPLAGDWNGNGIRSIGTFQAGVWQLDVNGDGRFDGNDPIVTFGRSGDLPVVGDFDGDGVEEIAIYRSGLWIIDSNRNYELDATDQTFDMGGSLDQPVVGDWDGDGTDEPGLYTESPKAPEVN